MPPKKDTGDAGKTTLLKGFEDKETKLLAAASVSSIGPDKYDYDLMAALTGNTAGSLKKMWPGVKKKALDEYPSFAGFLGTTGANISTKSPTKTAPKAAGGRKRKTPTEPEASADDEANMEASSEEVKPKPAPKKGGRKKAAVAESEDEEAKPAPKKGGRKPKAITTAPNDDRDTEEKPKPPRSSSRKASEEPESAPAAEVKKRGRPAKKVKAEEVKSEEDSADGGDGLETIEEEI